ncbi:MAG: DedA family protein [Chloroflexi bacterium]|nr:DedA family protein [Chloroflexota bacterium]
MQFLSLQTLQELLNSYGYFAVFLLVMLESTGIPLPGETMLIIAGVYASTGHISIAWVIIAAASGAIVGDNLGYWVGRSGGRLLVARYGRFVGLTKSRMARAEHFYQRHGDKTVFFGRFISVLRAWAAFLAGVNHMRWPRFLFFNAAGGILWATGWGIVAYVLGQNLPLLLRIVRYFGYATIAIVAVVVALVAAITLWRRQRQK